MKKCVPLFVLLFVLQTPFLMAQDFKVVGYLPYYRFSLADMIEFDKLTHLCIAFANPDASGNLSVNGQDIDPIVGMAHDVDVEVLISLAGGALTTEWENNWAELTKPANRSAFIHKMMLYVEQHQLDGVDVDLEFSHVDENYSGFVLELRDSLDQYGKLMTAALPGTTRYEEITDEAMYSFDFINMMIYNLTGPWAPNNPGPHSPYSFAITSINYWTGQGMAPENLTLGMPFYGYDFTNSNSVSAFSYRAIVDENPAYADVDQVGARYYNGRPTIQAKTELAMDQLAGVMMWELGQDALNEYSLLSAIDETINSSVDVGDELATNLIDFGPNPFRDLLWVNNVGQQAVRLQLLDMNGRLIEEKQMDGGATVEWFTSDLNAGFYFLRMIEADQIRTVKLAKS